MQRNGKNCWIFNACRKCCRLVSNTHFSCEIWANPKCMSSMRPCFKDCLSHELSAPAVNTQYYLSIYLSCARVFCVTAVWWGTPVQREKAETQKFEKSVRARSAHRKRENAKIRKVERPKKSTKKHEKSKIRKSEYTRCLCLMPEAAFKRMPFAFFLCTRWPRWPKGPRQVLHHRDIMVNSR